MPKRIAKKLLVIGWDAADWKVILPLIAEGKMPALKSLMDKGVHGKISTIDPPLSPILWTTIATGKLAHQHGITGFVEPLSDMSGFRPISSYGRKTKAIWNILNQNGLKPNVISWWPSNPVEPINGVMVSNLFQIATVQKLEEEWKLPENSVHPVELRNDIAATRVHPLELTQTLLLPFVPRLRKMKKEENGNEKGVSSIAKILSEMTSVHAASTLVQRTTEWDFMAVYHDAIDHFSHLCMKFHPPQLPGIPDDMYEDYKEVVRGGYMYQDMLLQRSLELIDEDTTVMILSDHGFHSDHLRPLALPKEPAAPAKEHNPFGIFVLAGPGIRKGERVHGVSLMDITPTILHMYGLPVGKDMVGKVLTQCFEHPEAPEYIPSWDEVEGDAGTLPPELQQDPAEAMAAMKQLIELGYVEAPDENLELSIKRNEWEGKYYSARNLMFVDKFADAEVILNQLFEETQITRYGQRLAMCLLRQAKTKKCLEVIAKVKELSKQNIENKVFENSSTEIERQRFFDPEIEINNYMDLVEGMVHLHNFRPKQAIHSFKNLIKGNSNSPEPYYQLGKAYQLYYKWEDAKKAYIHALSIDDEHFRSYHGLGVCCLRLGEIDQAIEFLLSATELQFKQPFAHYHLGEALYKAGEIESAVHALELCLSQSPGISKARRWLIKIYEENLKDPESAKRHRDFLDSKMIKDAVIVCGLPRSGTSMIMQMLEKGGYPVLYDNVREADEFNPNGYYELSPLFQSTNNPEFKKYLGQGAVKVPPKNIQFLPGGYSYKIILIERNQSEMLKSQQKALGKINSLKNNVFPTGLNHVSLRSTEKIQDWMDQQPTLEVLELNYEEVLENPIEASRRLSSFLSDDLDIEKMSQAVVNNFKESNFAS